LKAFMDNLPRQMLRRILAKHGKDVCADARRCEALLNDLCGAYRREINVLVNAIEEGVPLDLLAGVSSMPGGLLIARLEKRLEDQTGLTAAAARWAVESWALALGVATDAEIEERQRNQSDRHAPKAEKIQPAEFENKTTDQRVSNINRPNPVPPPKTRTHIPPPKTAPPANRPQTKIPQSSPPVHKPSSNQPASPPATNPQFQPPTSPARSKSPFSLFRGCLMIVFLLAIVSVALFFGVPYAIEVMRETQRERNSEPPRFPAR
jgi:hypothetical protein